MLQALSPPAQDENKATKKQEIEKELENLRKTLELIKQQEKLLMGKLQEEDSADEAKTVKAEEVPHTLPKEVAQMQMFEQSRIESGDFSQLPVPVVAADPCDQVIEEVKEEQVDSIKA